MPAGRLSPEASPYMSACNPLNLLKLRGSAEENLLNGPVMIHCPTVQQCMCLSQATATIGVSSCSVAGIPQGCHLRRRGLWLRDVLCPPLRGLLRLLLGYQIRADGLWLRLSSWRRLRCFDRLCRLGRSRPRSRRWYRSSCCTWRMTACIYSVVWVILDAAIIRGGTSPRAELGEEEGLGWIVNSS
jgi:hypothetical protein